MTLLKDGQSTNFIRYNYDVELKNFKELYEIEYYFSKPNAIREQLKIGFRFKVSSGSNNTLSLYDLAPNEVYTIGNLTSTGQLIMSKKISNLDFYVENLQNVTPGINYLFVIDSKGNKVTKPFFNN